MLFDRRRRVPATVAAPGSPLLAAVMPSSATAQALRFDRRRDRARQMLLRVVGKRAYEVGDRLDWQRNFARVVIPLLGRRQSVGSSLTRTSTLPKLRPASMPRNASGAFWRPSTTSSR